MKGDELLFTGERLVRGDMVRYQVSMKPVGDAFAFREERSVNGGPWTLAVQAEYVRRPTK
jgi:hypothetical protein